jgi:rhamnose transport system ATP-binding protein
MELAILELREIQKSFSGVHALRGVNFQLLQGEVHALLGENGAGKSTLIKVMTGVHQPDTGEIYLDGKLIQFADPYESRQNGIAAIYQEPSLFPDLDIAENIFVGRQPVGRGGRVDWQKMYQAANELLLSLGVHLDPKTKARNLSIAEQQMVEVARALSINARILIMDEPTSSLTLNEVADLFMIVRRLRENGTAIVFISHRLEELFEVADRVTVLRDGMYIDTVPLAGITKEELVRKMVGRTITDLFPKLDVQPGEVVLEVENLSRKGVFENVSFQLRKGEILGMAGLVGAGRTDVARTIFGITPATAGIIRIYGNEVKIRNPRCAMDMGLAYVPEDRQNHGLVLPLNIIANITLPTLPKYALHGWLREGETQQVSYEIASRMEVKASSVWQRARELSGGNQQKVVLAKWLSTNPRILILDEPTRGIDVGTKAAVHSLMSTLAANGMAILMISSELPEVLGMSDRIMVMHEGKVTGMFNRDEVTQEKVMMAATTSSH